MARRWTASLKGGGAGGQYARWGRKHILKKLYGLTLESFDEMLKAQGGVCAICKQTDKTGKFLVDHDHETGKVRGLLCRRCNHIIGLYERYGHTWDAYLARGR